MKLQSLRRKSGKVLALVALVAFLLISLLTGILEYREIRAEYSAVMQARINVASALIKSILFGVDASVESLLSQYQEIEALLSRFQSAPFFQYHRDSFYILDPQGRVLAISEPYREYIGLDFSPMIAEQPDAQRQVHHHYQSLLTKRSVVTVQYPLGNGYLLVVERNLSDLTSIMASFSRGQLFAGELIFVLSEKGQAIYHPDQGLSETRYNLGYELKELRPAGATGLFSYRYKGRKYIALQERFAEPSDWTLYYSVPASVPTREVLELLAIQLTFQLFFFLFLLSGLLLVFHRFFSRPVNAIVTALDRSTQGDGLHLTREMSGGITEFNSIIEAINSRDQEVADTVERFQTVLDSLDSLVYVADMETHEVLFINSFGRETWGDCIGRKCYHVLQQDQEGPCEFCTNPLLLDEQGLPTGVYAWESRNDRTGKWYDCRDRAIRWTDGRLVRMEIVTDISARKQAEEALQDEKERLAVTLRSIGDGVITTDTKGRIVYVNKMAEELTGWSKDEAQGRPSVEVFHIINEKTGRKCVSPVQRVMELGRIVGLANHTALVAKDGTVRSIADSGAPIRDRNSAIIGVVLVFRDISHEKKIEEELIKIRKLESVGVLAGGIAHDFNNILSAILGNIELVSYRVAKEDRETVSLLADAEKAAKRAAKLTGQLLTFSKGGEPVREIISLTDLIKESAEFVLHGSKVACSYSFPEQLWMVDVDSGQISQVIQNIILNAKHAMPEGGTIEIACSNVKDTAAEALLSVDRGDYVRITIKDTGVGIPREIIDKVFDPYFTTKQEGSGLGLAICHSIINKHDGYLTVDSTPGKGSTFTLYLPAVRSAGDMHKVQPERMVAVRAARIMVMDDEEMIRNLAKRQLTNLGHEVELVEDGKQAINRYQELQDSGRPVDIVILDLTIPGGMGGKEAARNLLRIDPDAKIIVASGYSNDTVMAHYQEYGFCASVSKPFDLKQLNKAIAAILR